MANKSTNKDKKKPERQASKHLANSTRGAARRMLERGFVPIPVQPGSKQPIGKSWQKQRPSEADINRLFTPGSNIGVLLGEPSGHLVDVDLDCPHAVAAAEVLMPPTSMMTGRPAARKSHRFYVAAGAVTRRFEAIGGLLDGERGTLVELRSGGAQTLMPPSTHPSGEIVSFESDGEPAVVGGKELLFRVALVAITALMARVWPSKGKRHATALSLAGFLLGEGVKYPDAERVVRVAAERAGDDEVESRVRNVASTANRIEAGQPVTGAQKLIELIGNDAVRQMRSWLRSSTPESADRADGSDTSDGIVRPRNTADALLHAVEATLKPEVFRSDRDPGTFVTATTKFGRQTFSLAGRHFRLLLGTTARSHLGRSVSPQAVDEVIEHFQSEALFGGVVHDLHVRIAEVDQGRTIYVDLGAQSSQVVRITKKGWRVIDDAPVRFVRPSTMQALPTPVSGGSLEEIWSVINVPDKCSRTLLLAWLACVFRESVPCPMLFVHGEQGAAKSTLTRFVHSLVDPSSTMLRSLPKDVHQLAIAAGDARVISMDNLSSIRRDTSDALCKLVTGASFPVRKFYTDSEERVFAGRRAMALNGIPDLAGFPDLAGRSLTLWLPRIDSAKRRTERELHSMFEDMRPRLLGALLDAVSEGLRREASQRDPLPHLERMADFCAWGYAVAPAIGSSGEEFLKFVELNRKRLSEQTIEASAIIQPLRRFLLNNRRAFEGTAVELLEGLNKCEFVPGSYKVRADWPESASSLGRALRREAGVIRDAGMELEMDLHSKGTSPKRIIKMKLPKRQNRPKRQTLSREEEPADALPRRSARRRS